MKKLLSIFILCAVCFCCYAVPVEYKVFKINGETLYKWVLVTKTKYDTTGNVVFTQSTDGTEYNYYYDSGLLIRVNDDSGNTYFEYDSKGNNIHSKSSSSEEWFKYDDKGRVTWSKRKYLNYKDEWTTVEHEYTYNDKGDVLSDGTYTYQYEYNSKGLKTKEIEKASFGTYEYNYEYNSKNQLIKQTEKSTYYDSVTEYEYDSSGNLILEKTSSGFECLYEYNDKNDVIHYRYSKNGSEITEYWCEYTYYPNGKVKEQTTYTHY